MRDENPLEVFNMADRIDFRDQIASNKWKSLFLMFGVAIIIVLLGYVISMAFDPGYTFVIMIIAIIFSLLYTWFSYYNSGKIAVWSVGAKEAERSRYRDYYNAVEGLTIASGLPIPKLYVMQSAQINAFASGRNPKNSVICVTEGALQKLDRKELEGVLAHELGHVASYDIRFMTLVTVMVGMVAIISEIFLRSLWFRGGNRDNKGSMIFLAIGIVLAIVAPIVVILVQLAISRKREYTADASAVKFTRYPQGLIGALKKIGHENRVPEKQVSKAVAPLFISAPIHEWISTHPPLSELNSFKLRRCLS
ncbi:M48 family metalloprotease [Candidatus Pacearchaeota archaeon]|nr:M48 family metalloprotease [Candidatus Pacearchaeota archaeon]